MSVATANPLLLTDGDAAFLRVDNRRPAHTLPPGVAADAANKRFDDGKPGPRHGVALDIWGQPWTNLVGGVWPAADALHQLLSVEVTGFTVGKIYQVNLGNADSLSATEFETNPANYISARTGVARLFLATQTSYFLTSANPGRTSLVGKKITARIGRTMGRTCAYSRFNDPTTNTDNGILLTDEWRDGAGEDGGRGRAWRIQSGNAPQAISLNGHDVWRTCYLEQAHNAMILARADGNERHYFTAANLDATADTLKIHCAPSWGQGMANARRVRFELASAGANIPSGPAAGNYYFAKYTLSGSDHLLELYSDAGCTNKITFDTGSLGKFYVELATDPVPWFGNGAPPLILQANAVNNAFELGFVAVTANVAVTAANATTELFTAPNHRLIPGDTVNVTLTTDTFANKYAAPQSEHTFVLYGSLAEALADSGTKLNVTVSGQTGSVIKTSASGLAIPPLRRIRYLNGRLWGIVNKDTIVQSDPFDFLHYTLYVSTVAANQGEAGQANWLCPLGEDVMLIGKDQKVIALAGISGPVTGWREGTITEEFGGLAPLAALNVGSDVWLFSRKGVASIVRTVAGQRLAVVRTVSHDVAAYLRDIDFANAAAACAATWNNRLFVAVPNKGQDPASANDLDAEGLPSAPSTTPPGTLAFGDDNGPLSVEDEAGPWGPYPLTITVTGVTASLTAVTLRLNNFSHNYVTDVHGVLVSPNGLAVKFIGAAGGGGPIVNVTITFDDAASGLLPDDFGTGTYRPTDNDASYVFPAHASLPAGPYDTTLATFAGMSSANANGVWRVYFADSTALDGGTIGGATLRLTQ